MSAVCTAHGDSCVSGLHLSNVGNVMTFDPAGLVDDVADAMRDYFVFLNNADQATILEMLALPTPDGDFAEKARFVQVWCREARARGAVA